MASKQFKKGPRGMTLEGWREEVAKLAAALNEERRKDKVRGYALVHVTSILRDPRPGFPELFVVSYSDHDGATSLRMKALLKEKRARKKEKLQAVEYWSQMNNLCRP